MVTIQNPLTFTSAYPPTRLGPIANLLFFACLLVCARYNKHIPLSRGCRTCHPLLPPSPIG